MNRRIALRYLSSLVRPDLAAILGGLTSIGCMSIFTFWAPNAIPLVRWGLTLIFGFVALLFFGSQHPKRHPVIHTLIHHPELIVDYKVDDLDDGWNNGRYLIVTLNNLHQIAIALRAKDDEKVIVAVFEYLLMTASNKHNEC